MQRMVIIFLAAVSSVLLVCSAGGVVFTVHELQATVGSDVRLPCTFSLTAGERSQDSSVEWEFQEKVIFFYYQNHSIPSERWVSFIGNIGENDATILLRNVTAAHQGEYVCRLRPANSPLIYKNSTQLRVTSPVLAQGRTILTPHAQAAQWPMYAGSVGGGFVLALALAFGLWAFQRAPCRHSNQGEGLSQSLTNAGDRNPRNNKDSDCYVTLGRTCAPPPPPRPHAEDLYITMHRPPEELPRPAQTPSNRKGLPAEWLALDSMHPESEHSFLKKQLCASTVPQADTLTV
nr:PREDICTED: uncharacterized protein LOC107075738 isoform X1 [Lepisosteus oculatus]XP_015193428.1 PREDICTED: uncharacterized protein LOC107075738 isoform X1 [Lepisosteus oculatus]